MAPSRERFDDYFVQMRINLKSLSPGTSHVQPNYSSTFAYWLSLHPFMVSMSMECAE